MAYKTKSHHGNNNHTHGSDYDLYGDVAKIKAALVEATEDVKGRAGEILTQSVENMREQSQVLRDNVTTYTSNQPFKSLGIALAVGVALGFLLRK